MGLRFLLDEDISQRVADVLRRQGLDAVSVHDLGRAGYGIADEEQLAYATSQGCVLITFNRADYQEIDARWRAAGRSHSGIFWCSSKTFPGRAIGDVVRALVAASERFDSLEGLCLALARASS